MSLPADHAHPGDHTERHSTISDAVRDVVLGMADGLTVPFALAAGVAAVASTHIVVTAGVAEIAAGAIAMALGGYLAARGEVDHFAAERARELRETHHIPDEERREVAGILEHYGLPPEQARATAQALSEDRTRWVDFMMRFELGLETPDPRRAPRSALTIGASYIAGGLIPLAPYFFIAQVERALPWSAALTLVALFGFGAAKGAVTDGRPWRSAVQTMAIGSLASAAAFTLARLVA